MTALQEHIVSILGECPEKFVDICRVSGQVIERTNQSWGALQITLELCRMEDCGWIAFSDDQHAVRLAGVGRA